MRNIILIISLLSLAACNNLDQPKIISRGPTVNLVGWQDGLYSVTFAGNDYSIGVQGDQYSFSAAAAPALIDVQNESDFPFNSVTYWGGHVMGYGDLGFTTSYTVLFRNSLGNYIATATRVDSIN